MPKKNKSKQTLLCLIAALLAISPTQASASLSPTPKAEAYSQVCHFPTSLGKTVEFSADYFEARLGIPPGGVEAVTLAALPSSKSGRLVLDGVEVSLYDALSRSELDRLCFAPTAAMTTEEDSAEGGPRAWFSFVTRGQKPVCATVILQDTTVKNLPPQAKNAICRTAKNSAVGSCLSVYDPNGDDVTLQISTPPEKGKVEISGLSYTYSPYPGCFGKDSFSLTAADTRGGLSTPAKITVAIDKKEPAFRFQDMKGSPSEYAAVKLCEKGVLSGEKAGSDFCFYPDREMNGGEFLVALLAAAELDENLAPCVNTGLSNDSAIPVWLKPYVKTALENGILIPSTVFDPLLPPSRAEAVCMVSRLESVKPVLLFPLKLRDINEIPAWAVSSYMTLGAHDMLSLHSDSAEPLTALTRAVAADLLLPVMI